MGKSDEELRAKMAELVERDARQIEEIRAFGVDLGKKRVIDLTFWAPDEKTAKEFAEACTRNEMPPQTVLGPAATETNRRWLVRCPMMCSVTFVTDTDNIGTFLMFADKYECEYDGWGTAIVEAAGLEPGS